MRGALHYGVRLGYIFRAGTDFAGKILCGFFDNTKTRQCKFCAALFLIKPFPQQFGFSPENRRDIPL